MNSSNKKVKYWVIAAGVAGAFTLLMVAGRFLGWWAVYTIQSPSQMPQLTPGSFIVGGSLQPAKPGRLILFRYFDDVLQQGSIFVFRCVAVGGDTVQLRAGRCYVNGRLADDSNNTWLSYELETERPLELLEPYNDRNEQIFTGEQVSVPLSQAEAAFVQRRLSKSESIKLIDFSLDSYNAWLARIDSSATINDCKAFVVPAQHFFVLGANRHNALDSRFIGPVHQDSVVGVAYFH